MNKISNSAILVIAIILSLLLIYSGNGPEFFDIFGFIGFAFIFIAGIIMTKSKKKMPDWVGFIILLIGIIGLIVDGFVVFKNYIA